VTKSHERPLIVEWPSADRAALEAQLRRGVVAVRYSGCEMEVLPRCKPPGAYAYAPLTRKTDRLSVHDSETLWASLPLGAARLEAALARAGTLEVAMTVVGRFESDRAGRPRAARAGAGGGAAHLVGALATGAFELAAGASAEAGGGVAVLGAGAGAKASASRQVLARDGDSVACERASGQDKAPPDGCGALLRVEVVALAEAPKGALQGVTGKSGGMVRIPAGRMRRHARHVDVGAFELDVTEVTADAYAQCIRLGRCDGRDVRSCPHATLGAPGLGDHPVNCVDFQQAEAYCASVGKRLPTTGEWEWAARGGPQARRYPWGDREPSDEVCWSGVTARSGTCRAGSFPAGASAHGVLDLAGGVAEWVTGDRLGAHVTRGQGFAEYRGKQLRAEEDEHHRATRRQDDLGFRCARSRSGAGAGAAFGVELVAPGDQVGVGGGEGGLGPDGAGGGAEADELVGDGSHELQHGGHRDVGVGHLAEDVGAAREGAAEGVEGLGEPAAGGLELGLVVGAVLPGDEEGSHGRQRKREAPQQVGDDGRERLALGGGIALQLGDQEGAACRQAPLALRVPALEVGLGVPEQPRPVADHLGVLRDLEGVAEHLVAVDQRGHADAPDPATRAEPQAGLAEHRHVHLFTVGHPVMIERPAGLLRPGRVGQGDETAHAGPDDS
jgi:hypothetical protein